MVQKEVLGTGIVKVLVPGIFRFFLVVSKSVVEKSLGTGIGKIWYRKKSWNRYRKKIGTEKSISIGIEQICFRKKYWYRLTFWVPSHTGGQVL